MTFIYYIVLILNLNCGNVEVPLERIYSTHSKNAAEEFLAKYVDEEQQIAEVIQITCQSEYKFATWIQRDCTRKFLKYKKWKIDHQYLILEDE